MTKQIFIPLLTWALLSGCSKQENTVPHTNKPVVYAVNYPLAYFAERIAGDRIDVRFPEIDGDPAFWNPAAEQIADFQNADLILLNGAGYAKWVPKVSLPPAKLINTAEKFSDQFIAIDNATSHAHGGGVKHAHGDIAFTTWLNPRLAMLQAEAICSAFSNHWTSNAEAFNEGLESLKKELAELDQNLEAAFAAYDGSPLVGSHPVYQYLTRRYALNMKSVHWEPDALPDPTMERELDDLLEGHPAKIMLWEGEPLRSIQLMLEKKGLRNQVFDPCGNRPAHGDYLSVMKLNLLNVKSR